MKRIDSFTARLRSGVGGSQHSTAIVLSDQMASIISDGYVCAAQPGVSWRHSSGQLVTPVDHQGSLVNFHPNIKTTYLIERGVITDLTAASSLIDSLLQKLPQAPSFTARHQGFYAVPVKISKTETQLFERVFTPRAGLSWQPLSHSKIYQKLLELDFGDLGQLATLAINAKTTDLVLWSDYQADDPLLSETIFWGTRDLERLFQASVRDLYQVQLSSSSMSSLINQLSDTLFAQGAEPSGSISVRAQALNSGRPTTINLPIAQLAQPAGEWLSYLFAGLKVILHRHSLATTAPIFERGLVVVGEGAKVADLTSVIGSLLGTSTASVSEPQDWLIKGLKHITKKATKEL